MGWILAIDIGTTSVTAAVREGNRTEAVEFADGPALSPAVFCPDGKPLVAGPLAAAQIVAAPDRTISSPKRALTGGGDVIVAGRPVPLAEAYAALLAAVAREAGQGRIPGTLDGLILTFPAGPEGRGIKVLRLAARLAGLPILGLVAEPIATACHLAAAARPGQLVAILDIGGGSVDAAVLRRTEAGFDFAATPGRLIVAPGDDPARMLQRGAYELLATLAAAGVSPAQLSALHVTGQGSRAPETAAVISRALGIEPRLAASPAAVAALGAFDAAGPPAQARQENDGSGLPPAAVTVGAARAKPGRARPAVALGSRKLSSGRKAASITGVVVLAAAAIAGVTVGAHRLAHAPGSSPRGRLASHSGAALSRRPVMAYVLTSAVATATVTVMPIDTATGASGTPIPVGAPEGEPGPIMVSPDGKTVVVATGDPVNTGSVNAGSVFTGAVTLISTGTSTARPPIALAGIPVAIAITPDSKTAYIVSDLSADFTGGLVTPVNIATDAAGLPIRVDGNPEAIAITPNGLTAYVTSDYHGPFGTVTLISTTTNAAWALIRVGMYPSAIAITPDGLTAYIVNSGNGPGSVTPITTATETARPSISINAVPEAIVMTPDGWMAYVYTASSTPVTPINIANDLAGQPIAVGGQVSDLVMSPDGQTVYAVHSVKAASPSTISVSPIRTTTGRSPRAITVPVTGGEPGTATITPDGKTLYLVGFDSSTDSGTVVPVSTVTGAAGRPVAVADGNPVALAITPTGVSLAGPLSVPSPSPSVRATPDPLLGAPGFQTRGCGTARPAYIYGGGDGSDIVEGIRWQSWGFKMAIGTGKALWVTTSVAAGVLEPVRLVAFNLGQLNGHYAYRSLDVYFPQHGQKFDPSVTGFFCGP